MRGTLPGGAGFFLTAVHGGGWQGVNEALKEESLPRLTRF